MNVGTKIQREWAELVGCRQLDVVRVRSVATSTPTSRRATIARRRTLDPSVEVFARSVTRVTSALKIRVPFPSITPLAMGASQRGKPQVPQPADIAHLLRRAGFGGTAAQIATLAAQSWATTVDQLLDFSARPGRHRSRRS